MTNIPLTPKDDCGCGEHAPALPELDARLIPHEIRHAAILGVVGSLTPGRALALVAPHDPKPLLAEIRERHGEDIAVSYLVSGPDAWKLKLARV